MADNANNTPQEIEDDPIEVRKAKRAALLADGKNPYGHAFAVSDRILDLVERYADLEAGAQTEDRVRLAGRLMSKRDQGKIIFGELRDPESDIQLFCRVNNLGDEAFAEMKDLDVGDWIGVEGTIMRTRRGELSVAVDRYELLSKSLRPLPEKFHGLADKELRYRQRYVDLIMDHGVRNTFRRRSQIISLIRRYMEGQGYIEVETPMMHGILGGANAKPFVTHFNALDRDFYLRIATELPLKRLLVGGMDRVFEIGRQFRNEGMDLTHNPEFTSMEAYCAFSDLQGMKDLTEGLFKAIARGICGCEEGREAISYQGRRIDLSGTWRSATVAEIASEVCGEELTIDTPVAHLREVCEAHHIEWQESWGAGKLLFEIYDELGEETLVDPTFVCDYPEEVSPLAKRKPGDPRLTDRFELVIAGHEYANAFTELNDPVDQAGRFAEQVAAKGFGDDEAMGYDYDYVRALEYGMPPAGGIGYGIDRMIMLFCDEASIRDVLLFPQMKPEVITKEDIARQVEGVATDNRAASLDAIAADSEAGATAQREREQNRSSENGDSAPVPETDGALENPAADVPAPREGEKLDSGLTRDEAFELLKKYNQDDFHIRHGETLEGLMRYYAEKYDPQNVEFWGQVGLLHDLDWEKWQDAVQHTVKTAQLLEEAGANPVLAREIQTHNSDLNDTLPKPQLKMEKVLYACDELSGLIQAAVLMRPSKSVMDFTVKSLKKKYKDKRFAAGCNRQVIAHGAELNDMELTDLFASVIEAMQAIAPDRDTFKPEA
ncbi:MAG: lysine--tRNA ligase [Eggerthellaceae bacterium]